MKRIKKLKEGYSLTEVVVGIFLLTIVWLAAVNIIVISRASGSLARHKVQAVYVIQQAIENLRKQPFANINSSTTTVSIDTRGTPDVTSDDFTGTQHVTVTTPHAHYKQVNVELDWNESFFGRSKTVKEYGGTLISDDPIAN